MAKTAKTLFFNLINFAVFGVELPTGLNPTKEELQAVYKFAKVYDFCYAIGIALEKSGLVKSGDFPEEFKKGMYNSVFRYQRSEYELERITELLLNEKIDHIALKGAVIRNFYPDPCMRNSCDLDVLVKENELDKVVNLLSENLGYTQFGKKHYHDVSLVSPSKVHLELHFNICENIEKLDNVLKEVWSYTNANKMTPEFFLFHHIAHMSYHFVGGGCGIKPFVDLILIKKNTQINSEIFNELLEKSGLVRFYNAVWQLINVWFYGKKHCKLTQMMEQYIFSGGVFGSAENRIAIRQQKTGGKAGYIFARAFLPYNSLKILYPFLEKHKWLTPFMQVARWSKALSKKGRKKTKKELTRSVSIQKEKTNFVKELLNELEI